MIKSIYAVFDTKAAVYNDPFYLINDAVAERTARQWIEQDATIAVFIFCYDNFVGEIEIENTGVEMRTA